ncbi:MAG: hypothetical protein AAFQ66_10705 [Pseudomonadota bacterium]
MANQIEQVGRDALEECVEIVCEYSVSNFLATFEDEDPRTLKPEAVIYDENDRVDIQGRLELPWRADGVSGKDLIYVAPPVELDFKTMHYHPAGGGMTIALAPFAWGAASIVLPSSYKEVMTTWYKDHFNYEQTAVGVPSKSLHYMSDPEEFGDPATGPTSTAYQIDFGTASPQAFWELITRLEAAGCEAVLITTISDEDS